MLQQGNFNKKKVEVGGGKQNWITFSSSFGHLSCLDASKITEKYQGMKTAPFGSEYFLLVHQSRDNFANLVLYYPSQN